jgi:alanine dehydrogenase
MQPPRVTATPTVVLGRHDVRELLDLRSCIEAVESAFRRHAEGRSISPAVLGVHVDGGGFHVKTAGMLGGDAPAMFVAKINANFPGNPDRFSLPTIQGVIVLFDASNGRVMALIDSSEITSVRTAAATAVAARHLARVDAATVTLCGCGAQARSQLRALTVVRPVRHAFAFDIDRDRASTYAEEMSSELGIDVQAVDALGEATRCSEVWVTCTPARAWFLGRQHVAAGAFIAAVGADHPEKQEIEPELLAESVVVADILDQCATIGDLHHALDARVMRREDVRAELATVIAGRAAGRRNENEIVVFDSTGTALQDVAAAQLVYDRATATGVGVRIDLLDTRAQAAR